MERLQKIIAQSGYCSRRKAEELILAGKVRVNGEVVNTLGTKVRGDDEISIGGKRLDKEEKIYFVMNKPKGCITSVSDEKGRTTVMDYVHEKERLFPVGRLDYDTSGVLLLTNDGEFTNLMLHPRYHLPKTYSVNLQGMLDEEALRKIRSGFSDGENTFQKARVSIRAKDYARDRMQIDLTVYEGSNHLVKNMMEALGCHVRKLHRSAFGNITADDLRPGEYRQMKRHDAKILMEMARGHIQ